MCIVENAGTASASYGPVAGNLGDLQTSEGHGEVVCCDIEGGEFGCVAVRDVLCQPGGKVSGAVGLCRVGYFRVFNGLPGARQWVSAPGMSWGRPK